MSERELVREKEAGVQLTTHYDWLTILSGKKNKKEVNQSGSRIFNFCGESEGSS